MTRKGRGRSLLVLATLALTALPVVAADVKPGDKFNASNVDQIKDLVSPGIEWCVKHGMPITITETKKIEWPRAYKEATEKYSGQVKLAPDGRSIEHFVAGMPFPNVDANDPKAAVKIMWNYDRRFQITDDNDLRNFDADTGTLYNDREMSVERHFLLDHFRRLYYVGRLYVDPKPNRTPNNDGVHYKETLHPILEPFDLKGVGGLNYRYLDPDRQDDNWLYLPTLRRVRRLSAAQRSDALFGQDTDVDSYFGYAGHIAWMDWKLLGEKEMLGIMHAQNYPVKYAPAGANWAPDDVWEKRKVWVVEGTSKLPQYAYSKRIIFIDKEAWVVLYTDIFDRAGNLWKVWINDHSFRKKTIPGAKYEYEDEQGFIPAIVMVDMQLVHATKASLPSPRFPGEEGWYFNKGEKEGATENNFTVAHLIEAGH